MTIPMTKNTMTRKTISRNTLTQHTPGSLRTIRPACPQNGRLAAAAASQPGEASQGQPTWDDLLGRR